MTETIRPVDYLKPWGSAEPELRILWAVFYRMEAYGSSYWDPNRVRVNFMESEWDPALFRSFYGSFKKHYRQWRARMFSKGDPANPKNEFGRFSQSIKYLESRYCSDTNKPVPYHMVGKTIGRRLNSSTPITPERVRQSCALGCQSMIQGFQPIQRLENWWRMVRPLEQVVEPTEEDRLMRFIRENLNKVSQDDVGIGVRRLEHLEKYAVGRGWASLAELKKESLILAKALAKQEIIHAARKEALCLSEN